MVAGLTLRMRTVIRPILGSIKAQYHMFRRDPEDARPIIVQPVHAIIFMAIFVYVGREDLAAYSLVAPILMTVGQMGLFAASELMSREQYDETLEIVVSMPSPLWLIILSRITVLIVFSLLGIVVSWGIIRLVFGITVAVHHPWLFVATVVVTAFASAGTTLITTALFCFARTARTYQNSVIYPVFLLGGILVPITTFPDWVQPISRLIYLYWSANLLRESMQGAAPSGLIVSFSAIAVLGAVGTVLGAWLIGRMLDRLRRDGRLGIL